MENKNGKAYGLDIGTAFFKCALESDNNSIEYKKIRNCFIELENDESTQEALTNNNWQYVLHNNKYYVVGEDAIKMARLFPGKIEVRRPMESGILSKTEDQKIIIMSDIIEKLIGKSSSENDVVTTSISSPDVEKDGDSVFHKARISGMISSLGFKVNVIEEGLAVVLAECPTLIEEDGTESKYSGAGISCGGGKVNCVLAYKGKTITGFSVSRSGDWVDKMVAESTNTPISQVVAKKEKKLDLNNVDMNDDVLYSLDIFYGEMLKFVFSHFAKKFKEVKSEFPTNEGIEFVIAGGTSMVPGFINKVEKIIKEMELPFKVKNIRHAQDPHYSASKGMLTHALVNKKKRIKEQEEIKKKNEQDALNQNKNKVKKEKTIQQSTEDLNEIL